MRLCSKVRVEPEVFPFLACLLMILPIRWVAGMSIAVMVHELFHIFALNICGHRIYGVTISATGAKIETDELTPGKELLCSLAGPLGGLSLIFLSEWLPYAAVCGMIQSGFNLIPLVPLDGGRALRSILLLILGYGRGERIHRILSRLVLLILFAVVVYWSFMSDWGILPMVAVGIVFLRLIAVKSPCKDRRKRVQ